MSLLLRLRADAPPQPPATDAGKQQPAGSSHRRRKRYEIDGSVYWLSEGELEQVMTLLINRPERSKKKPDSRPKRALEPPVASEPIQIADAGVWPAQRRFEALRREFVRRGDDELLSALHAAMLRLIDDEDEEILLLI